MIKLTDFALRHFDKKFGGTKVLDMIPLEFEKTLNHTLPDDYMNCYNQLVYSRLEFRVIDGYAPFCKLLAIPNFTDARVGSLPITLENYPYIRSGYSARTDNELPVFSRWLELPIDKPKADWLVLILYSKEQIDKEGIENKHKNDIDIKDVSEEYIPFGADWGIVAILGQSHPNEEPMKPETMIRNAGYNTEEFLGKTIESLVELFDSQQKNTEEDFKAILNLQGTMSGGSGVPLNKEKYLESVNFWSKNITVK